MRAFEGNIDQPVRDSIAGYYVNARFGSRDHGAHTTGADLCRKQRERGRTVDPTGERLVRARRNNAGSYERQRCIAVPLTQQVFGDAFCQRVSIGMAGFGQQLKLVDLAAHDAFVQLGRRCRERSQFLDDGLLVAAMRCHVRRRDADERLKPLTFFRQAEHLERGCNIGRSCIS